MQGGLGYRHRTELFVGWDVGYVFVDSVVAETAVGLTVDPIDLALTAEGNWNIAPSAVTRQALAPGLWSRVRVRRGLGLESRLSGEPWVEDGSQGIGFGLGASWELSR